MRIVEGSMEFDSLERCALEDALNIKPRSLTEELFMITSLSLGAFTDLRRIFANSIGRLVLNIASEEKKIIAYVARSALACLAAARAEHCAVCGHKPKDHRTALETILNKLDIERFNA